MAFNRELSVPSHEEYHPVPPQLCVENVEIQLGGCHLGPFLMSLPNLGCGFDSWDSRHRLVQLQPNYDAGVRRTGIAATYPNGCLKSGESMLMHTLFRRSGLSSLRSETGARTAQRESLEGAVR